MKNVLRICNNRNKWGKTRNFFIFFALSDSSLQCFLDYNNLLYLSISSFRKLTISLFFEGHGWPHALQKKFFQKKKYGQNMDCFTKFLDFFLRINIFLEADAFWKSFKKRIRQISIPIRNTPKSWQSKVVNLDS